MNYFDIRKTANPSYYAENVLPARSDHARYASAEEAIQGRSSLVICLDGIWKFKYAANPTTVPADFLSPNQDINSWDNILVPGHLQLQGYDKPMYVNVQYPWDGHEDLRPGQTPTLFNPIGIYARDFAMPSSWVGQTVLLTLNGAESAAAVWCNGHYTGYCTDSFTPRSFDLTLYLQAGVNRLTVEVIKWTSASWCEDQDFFRFSGLFRSVTLSVLPSVSAYDLKAVPSLDKTLQNGSVQLTVKGLGRGRIRAELYQDERIAIGNDERAITGVRAKAPDKPLEIQEADFRGAKKLSDCDGLTAASLSFLVHDPLLWSAENPNLYTLMIRLYDESGLLLEVIPQVIGFRRIEIQDGILYFNGKRIVFKGVNRHEFSSRGGRIVSREETLKDILAMKKNNINAVRVSHYPNSSYLYELCDRYGLYLIAENNLETHGTWEPAPFKNPASPKEILPGDDPAWLPSLLYRTSNCYQRDKNHPSVLIWSCGNESYGGKNLFEISRKFRELDPSRPVHYEGIFHDRRYPGTSDLESQMYPSVDQIRETIRHDKENGIQKPFICCEYSHAMGNSNGALYKYTALADTEESYQGGFIWDFIDQSLTCLDRYGNSYQAYGGDFDDRPNDGNFSGNGIFYGGDRSPSPKVQEVKYCYQNIEAIVSEYDVNVKNKSLFTSTDVYHCVVRTALDGFEIRQETLKTRVLPLSEMTYPLPRAIYESPGEYAVTVSFETRKDLPWAKAGHEVAFGQKVFRVSAPEENASPVHAGQMTVTRGRMNIGVRGDNWEVLFSGNTASMVSYRYEGREMIKVPPRPEFWRAPTDNDRGNHMPFRYSQWKTAGLYSVCPPSTPPRVEDKVDTFTITWEYQMPVRPSCSCFVSYNVTPDGTVRVTVSSAIPEELIGPPAFGMIFKTCADFNQLLYYGLGPEETYADRKRGAKLGIYRSTSQSSMAHYLVPQECGNRTGVRWAEVTDANGHGLLFTGNCMDFSILPYTPHELENAAHAYELPLVHYTVIRAGLPQMGVGGDDSWGALTHPEFLLPSGQTLQFSFTMKGI